MVPSAFSTPPHLTPNMLWHPCCALLPRTFRFLKGTSHNLASTVHSIHSHLPEALGLEPPRLLDLVRIEWRTGYVVPIHRRAKDCDMRHIYCATVVASPLSHGLLFQWPSGVRCFVSFLEHPRQFLSTVFPLSLLSSDSNSTLFDSSGSCHADATGGPPLDMR